VNFLDGVVKEGVKWRSRDGEEGSSHCPKEPSIHNERERREGSECGRWEEGDGDEMTGW
jgi:hypothetical protein